MCVFFWEGGKKTRMGLTLMEIVQGPAADKIVVVETVIVVLEMVVADE